MISLFSIPLAPSRKHKNCFERVLWYNIGGYILLGCPPGCLDQRASCMIIKEFFVDSKPIIDLNTYDNTNGSFKNQTTREKDSSFNSNYCRQSSLNGFYLNRSLNYFINAVIKHRFIINDLEKSPKIAGIQVLMLWILT